MMRMWLVLPIVVAGCADRHTANRMPAFGSGQTVRVYRQVGGIVQSLPANGTMFLQIEDIADFTGPNGHHERISKLVLPFRVEERNASGLKVGDRIACDLEVDWDVATPGRVLQIRR